MDILLLTQELNRRVNDFFFRYPDSEPEPITMELSQQGISSTASANKKHKRSGSTKKQHPVPPQVQLHSYSSSEEDLKSTPEYGSDSEKGKELNVLV